MNATNAFQIVNLHFQHIPIQITSIMNVILVCLVVFISYLTKQNQSKIKSKQKKNTHKIYLVSDFVDEIVTKETVFQKSSLNNSSSVEIECSDDSTALSIQWASIVSSISSIFLSCEENLLTQVADACNGESKCTYYYENDTKDSCSSLNDETDLHIEIGAVCMFAYYPQFSF